MLQIVTDKIYREKYPLNRNMETSHIEKLPFKNDSFLKNFVEFKR